MRITQKFSQDELERSMRESSSVLMLVITKRRFFQLLVRTITATYSTRII